MEIPCPDGDDYDLSAASVYATVLSAREQYGDDPAVAETALVMLSMLRRLVHAERLCRQLTAQVEAQAELLRQRKEMAR